MRWAVAAVISVLLLCVSCAREQEVKLPEDEVLIEIILDLHQAEATMNRVHESRQDSIAQILRERVAASYGITPETMDLWLETLQKSPEHMIMIYDSVIARYDRRIAQ